MPSAMLPNIFDNDSSLFERRWIALGSLAIFVYLIQTIFRGRLNKLPPGPRGLPLFGNLFQMSIDAWVPFMEWKEKYGPLVYINVLGQPIVIMNTHKVAADLLDRQAQIYSGRPRWIVSSEILTGGLLIVFTQYNDVWRRMRRASHEGLHKSVSARFHTSQSREAIHLVEGLAQKPQLWSEHIRRATASMIWSTVYDKPPILDAEDPRVARVNDFITRLVRAAFPGAHFVEFFTWMKYLPSSIAKWKREAEEWHRKDSEMFLGLYNEAKERVKSGEERSSFAAALVRDSERHGLSDKEASWLAATLYAAGAETTAGVLTWFMLAMVRYPEVQKKIQEELDAVVGRDRMPSFADYDHLPYIRATVREALRWHPVDPIGLPHQATEDNWYNGYFIPKGTICIANVWSLNRDVQAYGADAEHFNPGRFLDNNGQLIPALADTGGEGHVTYGFGRRICVGRHVANDSLFIDIASMLWALSIGPSLDDQGNPVIPVEDKSINDGLVVRPIPFDVSVKYRFPEAEAIVANSKELN